MYDIFYHTKITSWNASMAELQAVGCDCAASQCNGPWRISKASSPTIGFQVPHVFGQSDVKQGGTPRMKSGI